MPCAPPLLHVGTGYSIAGSEQDIPEDMAGMAEDLYEGLWKFFDAHEALQQRPLYITGESYAGEGRGWWLCEQQQQQTWAGGRAAAGRLGHNTPPCWPLPLLLLFLS